jgi:NADH-quinone oxidoreductase subunit E
MPAVKEEFVQEIIERYDSDPGMLIPMMQDLQAEYGYLPPEELKRLSKELGVPLTRVYGVAMFYSSFRLVPKGRHEVTMCMGTVCYLKGAPRISEAICTEYGIQPGGTTADRLFTLQAVNCVGACALAPVMIVDGKYYAGVSPDSALGVLRDLASQAEGAEAGEPAAATTSEAQPTAGQPATGPAPSAATAAEATATSKAKAVAPETGQPAVSEPAASQEQPPAPVPEKQALPKAARTAAKPRPKHKAGLQAASGSRGVAGLKAKARAAQAAKPAAAAKKEKPTRAAKKDKPGGAAKRASKGTKKGGRR